ncbi:LOW QUALITY PROTEIN: hypothetical protein CVT26_014944 [Gymnopilus dilepis]|uniref:F-box domain-containing protein n=1 Tax=Gymnopilus dilepis TaxID=231916 RepID=A0A409XWZ4_9AGAR|nr:LOW QUALITY PROTEIN: hypothetical protein CVT26_014944 [Gymnopilus dilepis]
METITFQSLPTELQLLCFSFMTVESLIVSSSVCSDWRRLVTLADIHPTRRRFFYLYRIMMDNPRPDERALLYMHRNLDYNFDREAYLEALLKQNPNCRIPEEFSIWVLEWPDKLPAIYHLRHGYYTNATGGSSRMYGTNYFALKPPIISRVVERLAHGGKRHAVALLIWMTRWQELPYDWLEQPIFKYRGRDSDSSLKLTISGTDCTHFTQWDVETWLMLDMNSKYYGKVVEYPVNFASFGGIFSEEALGKPSSSCPDWITYLGSRWLGVAPCGRVSSGTVIPEIVLDVAMRRSKIEKPGVLEQWAPDFRYCTSS